MDNLAIIMEQPVLCKIWKGNQWHKPFLKFGNRIRKRPIQITLSVHGNHFGDRLSLLGALIYVNIGGKVPSILLPMWQLFRGALVQGNSYGCHATSQECRAPRPTAAPINCGSGAKNVPTSLQQMIIMISWVVLKLGGIGGREGG